MATQVTMYQEITKSLHVATNTPSHRKEEFQTSSNRSSLNINGKHDDPSTLWQYNVTEWDVMPHASGVAIQCGNTVRKAAVIKDPCY